MNVTGIFYSLITRVADVLLKNLPCAYFDGMWDNPVAAAGHLEKVEQAMLGPPSLGKSSIGGELCIS